MQNQKFTVSLFSSSPNPAHNKTVEKVVSVSWGELETLLLTRNWSPAVYSEGTRKLSNYRGHPHLFAFDIDGGMTLAEARIAFKDYQCLIQPSRNHQKIKNEGTPSEKPACDRFRVVFPLLEPIDNDEDFKATWEAYADLYPLDPQTRSSSMYFFKGVSTYLNNSTGKPLAVIRAKDWNDVKDSTYSFVKDEANPTRGKISALSADFLAQGAPAGMFNVRLFKCAVDHLEQRYSQDEFLAICERAIAAKAFQSLDLRDISTIASAYNREPKYGARVSGFSYVEAQKQDIANRIMDGEFVQCVQNDSTLWYKISDYENKEVEIIRNEQLIDRHIDKELQKPENHYVTTTRTLDDAGKPVTKNVTKKMTVEQVKERWHLAGEALTKLPEPFLWRGVEGWCHKRFTSDLKPGQPHPAWDQFLSRLSAPDVFMAWVYSCFVPGHETRQALWLLGKNGEDGKTRVAETVASFFGNAAGVISGNQIKAESRFSLSQFLGKRLAIYPDCKYTRFTQTELFRNLTGGDLVGIELKNGGFLSQKLSTKVLVASNYEPETTSANYDKSRLLIIDVAESAIKDDPHWADKLKEEMPAFLGNAQDCYKRLCPNGGKIELSLAMKERVQDMTVESCLEHEELFDSVFAVNRESGADEWVTGIELMRVLASRQVQKANYYAREFRIYLEVNHNVRKERRTARVYYQHLVFRDRKTAEMFRAQAF